MADAPAIAASKKHLETSPHKATHDLVDHRAFGKDREGSAFAQHMVYQSQGYKTHTSKHSMPDGSVFYHVSAWRPKGQKFTGKPQNTKSQEAVTQITRMPMKKKELLEDLLKAQKEGKLSDPTLIAKVECADERVIEQWSGKLEKAGVPMQVNSTVHTPEEVKMNFSSGMLADKHKKVVAEAEKLGRKVMVHHFETPFGRVVHGMEVHDESVKKSQGDTKAELKVDPPSRPDDPVKEYMKEQHDHIESASHLKDHKFVQHTSHTMEDHHGRDDFVEHVLHSAEMGHKVHVTYHPNTETYHVSSWKPPRKKSK